MPIHNLGYREWDGERLSGGSRWSVIAGIGIRRAWQSKWLRRIAFVVWAPPLVYGFVIFMFEQVITSPGAPIHQISEGLEIVMPKESANAVGAAIDSMDEPTPEELLTVIRPVFWKTVLLQLQRSQSIGLIFVVGLIAPPLISQDVRSRAFLLYFSRPLTRLQYIAGKFATVASFLLLVCTLPQLLLYLFAVLLSPDISVVGYTWDLPIRSIVASIVMIVPTTMLALMLSSLTTETRFATFGWFTMWIFGFVAYLVVLRTSGEVSAEVLRVSFLFALFSDTSAHILNLAADIPDMATITPHIETQYSFAAGLTIVCAAIVFRKVSAPMRA